MGQEQSLYYPDLQGSLVLDNGPLGDRDAVNPHWALSSEADAMLSRSPPTIIDAKSCEVKRDIDSPAVGGQNLIRRRL